METLKEMIVINVLCKPGPTRPPRRAAARAIRGNVEKRNDQEDALDAEAKAAFRSEAEKLIARCESPLETVKALMACNCELETQVLALAHRYPGLVAISYGPTLPVQG